MAIIHPTFNHVPFVCTALVGRPTWPSSGTTRRLWRNVWCAPTWNVTRCSARAVTSPRAHSALPASRSASCVRSMSSLAPRYSYYNLSDSFILILARLELFTIYEGFQIEAFLLQVFFHYEGFLFNFTPNNDFKRSVISLCVKIIMKKDQTLLCLW